MAIDTHEHPVASMVTALVDVIFIVDVDGQILNFSQTQAGNPHIRLISWHDHSLPELVITGQQERIRQFLLQCQKSSGSTISGTFTLLSTIADTGPTLALTGCHDAATGQITVVGVDQAELVEARQQLVNAQLAMESDYWALRQIETRYRQMLDLVDEPLLVVDEQSQRIIEGNKAAISALSGQSGRVIGQVFTAMGNETNQKVLKSFLASTRLGAKEARILEDFPASGQRYRVQGEFLKQNAGAIFLLKLTPVEGEYVTAPLSEADFLQTIPDPVIVIDSSGRITQVNQAFLDSTQEASEKHVLGRNASEWLGRTGVDLQVLLDNLSTRQRLARYASTLRTLGGGISHIEISAITRSVHDGLEHVLFMRDTSRRLATSDPVHESLPSSLEQIRQRVGQLTLKELVRESTDVIEALCIESALELTGNNRASAAELLGLSRQSLYTKLRRFGISDTDQ